MCEMYCVNCAVVSFLRKLSKPNQVRQRDADDTITSTNVWKKVVLWKDCLQNALHI